MDTIGEQQLKCMGAIDIVTPEVRPLHRELPSTGLLTLVNDGSVAEGVKLILSNLMTYIYSFVSHACDITCSAVPLVLLYGCCLSL